MFYSQYIRILGTGFALFSMFFGAGNLVFPLSIGRLAEDQIPFALIGLIITAVGIPFLGLATIALYDGNYRSFFDRLGKGPSLLLMGTILTILGPFGAMPRCIAFSYGTLQDSLGGLSFEVFSILSLLLVFFFSYKKTKIINFLGFILTPLLIGGIGYMIYQGLQGGNTLPASSLNPMDSFMQGAIEGYQTMDLLAAIFFSSVIVTSLKQTSPNGSTFKTALLSSLVGITLLMLSYIGLSYIAATHSHALKGISGDRLLYTLSAYLMGDKAALTTALIVSLACLSTVISLAAVSAEFLSHELCQRKINYAQALGIVLTATFFVSLLKFEGIKAFLIPVLAVTYPALIFLCLLNIGYRLYQLKPVKIPFGIACGGSFLYQYLS